MKPYTYIPNFLSTGEAGLVFHSLYWDLAWEQREAPRKEYWTNTLDRPYTYGRGVGERTYNPHPTHPAIELVTDMLESHLSFRYEGCFLNRYENERDHLGWHADDDHGIDHSKPIAVVTVGAGRDIMIRPSTFAEFDKDKPVYPKQAAETVSLPPGSLLLMHPGMQQTHQHRIRKDRSRAVRVSA